VGDSDEDAAEIREGIIRHIETRSGADVAYDTAAESAVACGRGYWRIVTEYASEESFELELRIQRIRNRFSVYLDPLHTEPDGSDAEWGFVTERISKDEFKRLYPNAQIASWESAKGDTELSLWISDDSVLLADYYYKDYKKRTIVQLEDGTTKDKSEIKRGDKVKLDRYGDPMEREVQECQVKHCKMGGGEPLEEADWPSRWLPIVKVIGEEQDIGEKCMYAGIVRNAKDPQKAFNYSYTAHVEYVGLQPKSPWVIAEGQDEGYEREFQEAHIKNRAVIHYKPTTHEGQLVPPPQRAQPITGSVAMVQQIEQARNDLKSVVGMYNPSLGASAPEKSGRAIIARQREADTGTFHFQDNLSRSVRHCGRILLDMIPRIYDTKRVMRIIDAEQNESSVMIGENELGKPYVEEQGDDGEMKKIYDLSVGDYDVVVTTGPSFATKRLEATDAMLNLVQSYPPLMQIAGDLVLRQQDWPGAEEISKRLQMMLPPQVQQSIGQEGEDPKLQMAAMAHKQEMAQVAGHMQAMQEAIQQKDQQIQELDAQLKDKSLSETNKAHIAEIQAASRLEVEEIRGKYNLAEERMKQMASAMERMTMERSIAQGNGAGSTVIVDGKGEAMQSLEGITQALAATLQILNGLQDTQGQIAKAIALLARPKTKTISGVGPSGKSYDFTVAESGTVQ
jgi:hypothetical protein